MEHDPQRPLIDQLAALSAAERDALLAADRANLRCRLERAELIVGMHHAHQNRFLGDRLANPLGVYAPVRAHTEIGHLPTEGLEIAAGLHHRAVFDRGRDDMLAVGLIRENQALDGPVDGLRYSAGNAFPKGEYRPDSPRGVVSPGTDQ